MTDVSDYLGRIESLEKLNESKLTKIREYEAILKQVDTHHPGLIEQVREFLKPDEPKKGKRKSPNLHNDGKPILWKDDEKNRLVVIRNNTNMSFEEIGKQLGIEFKRTVTKMQCVTIARRLRQKGIHVR